MTNRVSYMIARLDGIDPRRFIIHVRDITPMDNGRRYLPTVRAKLLLYSSYRYHVYL